MKKIWSIAVASLFILLINTAVQAQDGTGNSSTSGSSQSSQTDSSDNTQVTTSGTESQGTQGNTSNTTTRGTDQTGSNTGQGANSGISSGTDSSGTTGTGSSGMGSTGTTGSGNTGSSTSGTMSGTTGSMGSTSGAGTIHNLSGLDQDASEEIWNQFKPVAEEHANQLVSRLGLKEGDADDIRSSIMDYFDDVWESRVEFDQQKGDTEEERENNEDLADERVELVSEIEDELSDEQANQWKSFKVDWWKSLDTKIFEIQQNATSTMSRSNDNMQNNNNDNQE